jgi:integrase
MLKLTRRNKASNWYIRGTIQGQAVYESAGTRDRKTAEIIRAKREREITERIVFGAPETMTFAEAAMTYMEASGESRFLAKILQFAGPDTALKDITNQWLNQAAKEIYPKAAASTINRQLITPVSAVYSMAAKDGIVPQKTFRRRKTDKTGKRWLTPEEADRLIANADDHLVPILACLLGTGARTSEALSVQAHYFYPNTGEIFLEKTKNEHSRMLRMPRRALDMILASDPPDIGRIFLTPKGHPYVIRENGGGQIQASFNKARDLAGLEKAGPNRVTPHTCRHTWATWFYAATKDFGGLTDMGGWEKTDMANHYRKAAPSDLPDRLLAHGWDFNNLGKNIKAPAPKAVSAEIHTLKQG